MATSQRTGCCMAFTGSVMARWCARRRFDCRGIQRFWRRVLRYLGWSTIARWWWCGGGWSWARRGWLGGGGGGGRGGRGRGDLVRQRVTDWAKAGLGEFCSVYEVAWNVPGEQLDAGLLPARAFASEAQRERTLELIARYDETQQVSPELDGEFAKLAW